MTVTESSSPLLTSEVDSYIHFAEGLVGCNSWKRFVVLSEQDEDLPVAVLQCVDEPSVALMVTDPNMVMPGYDAPLSVEDRRALGLGADARPVLYCTLTIAKDGGITANLLGPLAINTDTRQARQLVLAESTYSARHPVGAVGA